MDDELMLFLYNVSYIVRISNSYEKQINKLIFAHDETDAIDISIKEYNREPYVIDNISCKIINIVRGFTINI